MQNDRYQRRLNWALVVTASLWSVLAVICALFDLQISIALVRPDARWAIFLERYGEYPASYLLITALLTVIVWTAFARVDRSNRTRKRSLVRRYLPQAFRQMALVTIIMNVICRLGFVVLSKRYWGRVRFKDLSEGLEEFTPWYVINGVTGDYSFMSGHAASAWMVLVLIILTRRASSAAQFLTFAIAASYGVLMAVSRVRLGAHYASDVLFSTGVCVTVFILSLKWIAYRETAKTTGDK